MIFSKKVNPRKFAIVFEHQTFRNVLKKSLFPLVFALLLFSSCTRRIGKTANSFELEVFCPEWCEFMAFSFVEGVSADDAVVVVLSNGEKIPTNAKPGDYVFISAGTKYLLKYSGNEIASNGGDDGSEPERIAVFIKAAKPKESSDSIFSYSCKASATSSGDPVISASVGRDGSATVTLRKKLGRYVIEPSNENGDWFSASGAKGLYEIGNMYFFGEGARKSIDKSIGWFAKAADYGSIDAMMDLADMYYKGDCVARDYRKSAEWYKIAAANGSSKAMYNLGTMYCEGIGVAQDYNEAAKWWRQAADAGNVKAMYNLGSMFYFGIGVDENHSRAVEWYRKAASKGDENAKYRLNEILKR